MKKVFLFLVVLILLLVGAVIAVPFLFKDKIVEIAKTELNKNLNAEVDFKDMDLSLIRNFPDFTLAINGFSVVNQAPFDGDTLLAMENFLLGLDLMSVISGDQIQVNSIILDQPVISATVLEDGSASWDIVPASDEAESEESSEEGSQEFQIGLQKLAIENARIVYRDAPGDLSAEIVGLNHSLSGDFTASQFVVSTQTDAETVTVVSGGVPYLNKTRLQFKADLDVDLDQSSYTFKQNELALNALRLVFDGWIKMPGEAIEMDLTFSAPQTEFKHLLSLVPNLYTRDFEDIKTSGKLELSGFAKGTYLEETLPAFELLVKVNDAMFQYPDLPTAVNNILIDAQISNPGGDADQTVVNVSDFKMDLGTEPFSAKLKVTQPVSDPDIDLTVNGKIDLANVSSFYPMEGVTRLEGKVDVNMTAKGKMSAIEKEQYDQFNASGNLKVADVIYEAEDLTVPVNLKSMDLTFNPRSAVLSNFDATVGKSDLKMDGSIDNVFGFALSDQPLKGSVNLRSNHLDLNELSEASVSEETEESDGEPVEEEVVAVPDNLDFVVSMNAGKVLYDNYILENVQGNVVIRDEVLSLNNLTAGIFNGNVGINGKYNTQNLDNPTFDFGYDLNNLDVKSIYESTSSVDALMPVARFVEGRFSADMNMSSKLNQDMTPDLPSVLADGKIKLFQASISGMEVLNKIGDKFKIKSLKAIELRDIWTLVEVKNGRIFVDPFEVKQGDIKMNISGSHGLDQTQDYNISMEIPRSKLGAAGDFMDGLLAQSPIPGFNALPATVPVNVKVKGTVAKPKLSFAIGNVGGGTSAKDLAKAELDKQKAAAKAELDKQKAAAEAKARAEADKLKKEAEAKAKAEADKLKKEAEAKAKEEAKKALKGLFGKPK